MPDVELESLLSPLAGDAPCGADLEYDPAFLALLEAGAAKTSQQYGDTIIPPQDPDWASVLELARQLAARTRDLRVAVWLTRSGARLTAWPARCAGCSWCRAWSSGTGTMCIRRSTAATTTIPPRGSMR